MENQQNPTPDSGETQHMQPPQNSEHSSSPVDTSQEHGATQPALPEQSHSNAQPYTNQQVQQQYQPNAGQDSIPYQVTTPPTESIGGAFGALWTGLKLILSGRLVDAFSMGHSFRRLWPVATISYIVLTGLLYFGFAISASRGVDNALTAMLGGGIRYVDNAFTTGLKLFLVGAVASALFIFARIAGLYFTLKLRGVQATFATAATIWSVSVTPLVFVLALGAIFGIIPVTVTAILASMILGILGAMAAFMSELSIYVGLNQIARPEKSILIPHTLFTALSIFVAGFIGFIIIKLLVS